MRRFSSSTHRFHVVMVLAAVLMVSVAMLGEVVVASNMAFKLNKGVPGTGLCNPALPRCGQSYVALPFRTPILTAADLCAVLGTVSSSVELFKFTGSGAPSSFNCAAAPGTAFPLNDGGAPGLTRGMGVLINNKTAVNLTGIIVGSHIPGGGPAGVVPVPIDTDGPGPLGKTYYAVPYHTTNVTAFDICANAGIVGSATLLTRNDGATAAPFPFSCAAAPGTAFPLVLGEAVEIVGFGGPAVPPFTPAHF